MGEEVKIKGGKGPWLILSIMSRFSAQLPENGGAEERTNPERTTLPALEAINGEKRTAKRPRWTDKRSELLPFFLAFCFVLHLARLLSSFFKCDHPLFLFSSLSAASFFSFFRSFRRLESVVRDSQN